MKSDFLLRYLPRVPGYHGNKGKSVRQSMCFEKHSQCAPGTI